MFLSAGSASRPADQGEQRAQSEEKEEGVWRGNFIEKLAQRSLQSPEILASICN